jgi:hypothetical protein
VFVQLAEANPKNEIRNPKQTRNPKKRNQNARGKILVSSFLPMDFGFVSDFDIRISSLRFRRATPQAANRPPRIISPIGNSCPMRTTSAQIVGKSRQGAIAVLFQVC